MTDEQKFAFDFILYWDCPVRGAFRAALFIEEASLKRERSKAEFRDLLRRAFTEIGERAMRDWEALHGQS
jgi:hypothetical protein